MSPHVPAAIDRQVRLRAGARCEYCHLSQEGQEATFHIDHIQPRKLAGETTLENLALACVSCSLRKGARTTSLDPQTGESVGSSTLAATSGASTTRWTETVSCTGSPQSVERQSQPCA